MPGRAWLRAGWPVGLLLVAVLLPGCGRGERRERIAVLGLDGMDPDAIDLLMSEGKMPSFARLRQEGAYGRLISMEPMISPVLWTTMATGKRPEEHGIGHFVAGDRPDGEKLPVTSQMRRVKALWNIASERERTVAVVGWWATWPAERVNGVVVSDHTCYHFLFPQGDAGGRTLEGVTHPPGLIDEVSPMIRRPGDLTAAELGRFAHLSREELARPFAFDDEVSELRWALATAESYRTISLHLWRSRRPDLLMVYIEGTDSVSHLFGHLFRVGELSGELAEQQQRFGSTVEAMYRYADEVVGQFLEAMDKDSTLMVISDHGFALGTLHNDPSVTRTMRRVSERFHRREGIIYLYGNHVRPGGRLDEPGLLDIAPTLLSLSGLEVPRDMPGRVLAEGLDLQVPARRIATYESRPEAGQTARTSMVDPEILAHLRSLGYLSGDASSPQGDRNLAGMAFEGADYARAAEEYATLVRKSPRDAALRTSYAGALGALGRYEEALAQLDVALSLDPLDVEAYHNRAVISERRGDPTTAVELYRTALRYNPDYAPSRKALLRLTGSEVVYSLSSAAEVASVRLAEQAKAAAERGDYPAAMSLLDQAERTAPRLAVVYQYRSNVAYLMNDLAQAISALEKAHALDPENALYSRNLEILERRQSEASGK